MKVTQGRSAGMEREIDKEGLYSKIGVGSVLFLHVTVRQRVISLLRMDNGSW
jgi:hypothetical protein